MLVPLLVTVVVVCASVLVHYEVLLRMMTLITTRLTQPRHALVFGILAALLAHVVEVWIFALGYWVLINAETYGTFVGGFNGSLWDCAYYSFVTYTTLGFGDLVPTGSLRFLTGIEALAGLVLITWTASFLYIQMQRLLGGNE